MRLPPHELPTEKPYAFKSRTEKVIDKFVKIEKPTQADLNSVIVQGQIEEGILKMLGYIADGYGKSQNSLESEVHNSELLGQNMEAAGDKRPGKTDEWDAHAIVSGGHPRAAALRGILAWLKIRIDDPDNGCWLPHNTAAKIKTGSPAVPHSRIHRKHYYMWMDSYINLTHTKTQSHCRFQLDAIRAKLLNMANLPDWIMLPAGAELS